LANDDKKIQSAAAGELAAANQLDVEAVSVLIAALVDGDERIRSATSEALKAHPAAATIAAASLLSKMTDESLDAGGRPIWYVASLALGRLGDTSLPTLLERLEDANPMVVRATCVAIAEIEPPAKPAVAKLIPLLTSQNDDLRHIACHVLIAIGPTAKLAVNPLTKLLDHENLHTQYWSCRALGSIGAPAALPAVDKLISLTREGAASVRRNAVMALGEIGIESGPKMLQALSDALQDKTQPVRAVAAEALTKIGPPAKETLPALKQAIDRPFFRARVQAALAIWKISGETEMAVRVLLEEFESINAPWEVAAAFSELGEAGASAVPGLTKLLTAAQATTRLFVIDALAAIGVASKPALPALVKRLDDDDHDVRAAARQAIDLIEGKLQDKKS
jgi:HEAT repeat protein